MIIAAAILLIVVSTLMTTIGGHARDPEAADKIRASAGTIIVGATLIIGGYAYLSTLFIEQR